MEMSYEPSRDEQLFLGDNQGLIWVYNRMMVGVAREALFNARNRVLFDPAWR